MPKLLQFYKKIGAVALIFVFSVFFGSYTQAEAIGDQLASSTEQISSSTTESILLDESPWGEEEYEKSEPIIRVGIYKTDKKVQFISPFIYDVVAGEEVLGTLGENELASLSYKDKIYYISSNSLNTSTSTYFRLIPRDPKNYFSIFNLDRHLVTRSQMNFATFRGSMEYRFAPKSAMPYVINELLLEDYVSGIGETSNGAPEEYIKALQIAARSYAYSNIGPPPTENRMFDVYASTVDQLYLGYNFEQFSPRIALFTVATRGMMVTYKDEPVVTYYYSRSNGKTKTKKGVPWLKSVVCKYDKGWRQLGHGYGMSNRDAAARAKKDKWNYDKILTYYYSGTEIKKIYD